MSAYLWIFATVLGAAAQTARNAAQLEAMSRLGARGAAAIRFLYGLPFSLVFLLCAMLAFGSPPPVSLAAAGWSVFRPD